MALFSQDCGFQSRHGILGDEAIDIEQSELFGDCEGKQHGINGIFKLIQTFLLRP